MNLEPYNAPTRDDGIILQMSRGKVGDRFFIMNEDIAKFVSVGWKGIFDTLYRKLLAREGETNKT